MEELAVAEQDAPPSPSADAGRPRLTREAATDLVLRTVAHHADALLRTARRHSLCADDAHDAYQRGLEIFMRRAATLDPATASRWLHVVVKHEAMAVRSERMALVAPEEVDLDRHEAASGASPEELALRSERVTRTTEALQRLKPQELRAMWLKALGSSYEEICAETGWTYTKVNRCLAEGRKTFLERYAGIESGEECERWQPILSAIVDGEARPDQLTEVRPHLRSCPACRATLRELHESGSRLRAVLPVGLIALPLGDDAAGGDGVIGRLAETFTSMFHERAAASAMKVQAALEASGVGKVAAVAASAAAVAGGGAAAARHVSPDRAKADPTPAPRRAAAPPTSGPTAGTAELSVPSMAVARHLARTTSPGAGERPRRGHKPDPGSEWEPSGSAGATGTAGRTTAAAIEFAPEPAPPPTPTPSPSPSLKQSPRPMNGGEFDP